MMTGLDNMQLTFLKLVMENKRDKQGRITFTPDFCNIVTSLDDLVQNVLIFFKITILQIDCVNMLYWHPEIMLWIL